MPIRIAEVLTPPDAKNLRLAAQIGVEEGVARYPGPAPDDLARERDRFDEYGIKLTVIEGHLPIDDVKLAGPRRDDQIDELLALIRNMGRLGVPVLCYNFMPTGDWARTDWRFPTRGGALVSKFDLDEVDDPHRGSQVHTTDEQMWENLRYFLERVLPVAEDVGVKLAMHPDDPPLSPMFGYARIMTSLSAFERLLDLDPRPANGICFCLGNFLAMGGDPLDAFQSLASRVSYIHFRDVRGRAERFVETFHDDGPTDMSAVMRAFVHSNIDVPLRCDHVPLMVGEDSGEPGYTMLGRLFAVGYIRGLLQGNQKGR